MHISLLRLLSPEPGSASGSAPGAEPPAAPTPSPQENSSVPATFTDSAPEATTVSPPASSSPDPGSNATSESSPAPSPDGKPSVKDSEFARRRREYEEREAKRMERAVSEARDKAIIDALGGENPYTHKPMSDSSDVRQFLAMKEIEKNGGDPLNDFPEYKLKEEKAAAQAEDQKRRQSEWFDSDRAAFQSRFPDVELSSLISDPSFRSFSLGKIGNVPLAEIYSSYLGMVSEIRKKSDARAAQAVANSMASPGALSGSSAPDSGFFTVDQVRKMSDAEVKKNYDKIRESMTKW